MFPPAKSIGAREAICPRQQLGLLHVANCLAQGDNLVLDILQLVGIEGEERSTRSTSESASIANCTQDVAQLRVPGS